MSVDVEADMRTAGAARFPTVRVVTETPANLADVLPVIQMVRAGGREHDRVLDVASVVIDVYAATRQAARALAVEVRDWVLWQLPGTTLASGAVVPKTTTLTAPSWRPYDNTNLRRVGATYDVTVKSPF